MSLDVFLKMAKDSAVRIEIGRSFHQLGTVQEKVRESDLVPLWDGTTSTTSTTLVMWSGHIPVP